MKEFWITNERILDNIMEQRRLINVIKNEDSFGLVLPEGMEKYQREYQRTKYLGK